MNSAYFVTGTDTGIGKTLTACAMLHALDKLGVRAAGMKPVAAARDGAWPDVDAIMEASSVKLRQDMVCPYQLRAAVAPHIAADLEDIVIEPGRILASFDLIRQAAQVVVVEGAGGFRVPLSGNYDSADLARELRLPVVLVVGLRQGCINHALITAEAIAARGLSLAGWVANVVDLEMRHGVESIEALSARLDAPLLGCIPRLPVALPAAAADHLDFSLLPDWPAPSRPVSP